MAARKKKEKRRFSRVVLTRSARLHLASGSHEGCPLRNLSLSGVLIEGVFPEAVGEEITVELHEAGKHSTLVLSMTGKVIRQGSDYLAVEFTHMEPDSYMFLQTMLLYSSEDPIGVAVEFLDDFPQDQIPPC